MGKPLESQMIYLDGRPRPPENVHLQLGAARGHWDGDTLVVEYTNFVENGGRPRREGASDRALQAAWTTCTCFSDLRWMIPERGRNRRA